jgi:hypothetical protein
MSLTRPLDAPPTVTPIGYPAVIDMPGHHPGSAGPRPGLDAAPAFTLPPEVCAVDPSDRTTWPTDPVTGQALLQFSRD